MKSKLIKLLKMRKAYYIAVAAIVLATNVHGLMGPVYGTADYIWSRQQSVAVQFGRWDTMNYNSPVRSVHAALLRTGKVLLIAGSGNNEKEFDANSFRTVIWDPNTGDFKEIPTPWDAFCAGHVFLPDGKLLVAGGTAGYEDLTKIPRVEYKGLKDSYIFDPETEQYEKVDNMDVARWYPTLVALGDGKVLAAAGLDEEGKTSKGETEIYDPATKQWTTQDHLKHVFPTYPSLILMADGRLFYSGGNQGYEPGFESIKPGIWDLNTNLFQQVTGLPFPARVDNSATVLLPPAQDQRVMMMGGAISGDTPETATTDRTAIIDLDESADPHYHGGPNLEHATRYPSAVILPDDTVLKTGGSRSYRNKSILSAEIFNPLTNTFSKAATPRIERNYHSEAILLPDGRVATFGSNPIDNSFELRIEVYSPAYLFKGPRPEITGGDTVMTRGTTAQLKIGNTNVKTAKLIRPSAVTHVTDVEQRSVNLPFTKTADGIQVQVPDNPNLVPPGWYMAFVTDDRGVPSKAFWVRVP